MILLFSPTGAPVALVKCFFVDIMGSLGKIRYSGCTQSWEKPHVGKYRADLPNSSRGKIKLENFRFAKAVDFLSFFPFLFNCLLMNANHLLTARSETRSDGSHPDPAPIREAPFFGIQE